MRSEIIITNDGSSTLYIPHFKEHYHSVYGAVQESMHVFIQAGLKSLLPGTITILEVGFGTGLNALLTMMHGREFQSVTYHTVEKYPLDWETVKLLSYDKYLGITSIISEHFRQMHISPWDSEIVFENNFSFYKTKSDIRIYQPRLFFDLMYFDAFSPAVQPELWEEDVFSKLYNALLPGGILVTYCAKGDVRRKMQCVGFDIERLQGPPGKREIIRATRPLK